MSQSEDEDPNEFLAENRAKMTQRTDRSLGDAYSFANDSFHKGHDASGERRKSEEVVYERDVNEEDEDAVIQPSKLSAVAT